ncbi:guanine nucleotide exchange factor [Podospora appendiculata]|uniref:Guanine nucleotide exchange factor n=1 Tax=Podospora appendiculata TaxID=314037 RepID=A0AAE1CHA7_9PEZI|nr:guanine nucleotide exchange factor [Podospora appendiculata]
MSHPSVQGSLTGSAKLRAVTDLVDKLAHDLEAVSLLPPQRDAALEELKIYGRDPRNADPIFTTKGIETLARHAFDSPSSTTSRNALRVLCNAMLLEPKARQIFGKLGYEAKACSKLKNDSRDDEFLASRVIFLTTYGTSIDLPGLVEKHHLADILIENLSRHAKQSSAGTSKADGKNKIDPMAEMALSETLRLLFNITKFCSDHVELFTPAIAPITTLLSNHDIKPDAPLSPPFGPLINALMNLKLDSKSAHTSLFPKSDPSCITERLVQLLDQAMKSYPSGELELHVTPLVCVISSLHEHAPDDIRKSIRASLLPTEEDRKTVLGKGDSLASRLLQNSTNPVAPELRKSISHLLFEMSDKDASTFIENVGYGFASGFLFQNNIPLPEAAAPAVSDERNPINPVTGQFLDAEKFADMPEMTDEEKEREAEKLFVLFERLKKNGLISVQNPVEKAVQEGRFEELADDYEEDDE